MFSGSGKGGFAPGELVRNVGSDRFHVEEMRRRALAERAQHDAEGELHAPSCISTARW